MAILFLTPDYASHYLPLVSLGAAWQATGVEVVVATGDALRERIHSDGFTYRRLQLTERSNGGLQGTQLSGPDDLRFLRENLDATRRGMVETLTFQAENRERDLFWRPDFVREQVADILAQVKPSFTVSVQLSYTATAALLSLGAPFATFVTGHPAQLPGPGEVYGYPSVRSSRFDAPDGKLRALWTLCRDVQERFTKEFNLFLRRSGSRAPAVANALAASSPRLQLHNYPAQLGSYREPCLPGAARWLGSSVREERLDDACERWLAGGRDGRPVVLVTLGSFFSLRGDVLRRLVDALRDERYRVVFASGVAPIDELGVPAEWHVRSYLPQVALLRHCDLVICHGGNNTVTEALTAGVPLLVGPFSSDQFAGAADIERNGLGGVFDPNRSDPGELRRLIGAALEARPRARALGEELRQLPGAVRAMRFCEETFG